MFTGERERRNDDGDDRITESEFGTVTDVIQAYNGDGEWPSSGSD